MELVGQFGNTIAIAVVGVLVWFYLRGRFEQVDRRFDQIDRRFDQIDRRFVRVAAEIGDLRADVDRKFELMMSEINAVRSDLTHVALAVGARTRPEANPA